MWNGFSRLRQACCQPRNFYVIGSQGCPKWLSGLSAVVLKGTTDISGRRNTAMKAHVHSHQPVSQGTCFL